MLKIKKKFSKLMRIVDEILLKVLDKLNKKIFKRFWILKYVEN